MLVPRLAEMNMRIDQPRRNDQPSGIDQAVSISMGDLGVDLDDLMVLKEDVRLSVGAGSGVDDSPTGDKQRGHGTG